MLPGLDVDSHLAAWPRPAGRRTWPFRVLSSRHPFAAPKADGAAQPGLSRPALPAPGVRSGVRGLARGIGRATRLPRHGRDSTANAQHSSVALAQERGCEADFAVGRQADLDQGVLPDLAAMIERFRPKDVAWPTVV